MNKFCECPISGWCARHSMIKGEIRHQYCQGKGNKPDCGLAYWQMWERGEGGATAPDSPEMEPEGFCESSVFAFASNIGTALHDIFIQMGAEIPCEDCRKAILAMNMMTPEQVKENRVAIVQDIKSRAIKQAPKLWQKIAIFVDDILDTKQVEARLNKWLDQAIITGTIDNNKRCCG